MGFGDSYNAERRGYVPPLQALFSSAMSAEQGPVLVSDVVASIDAVVPLAKAAGWDPVGLQLGDDSSPVRSIAVCHEVTAEVVDMAIEANTDVVVSYHPLLFSPTNRIVAGRSASGRAAALLRRGVSLVVVHTAFDVAPGGAADALADALGLATVEPIGPSYGPETVKLVTFVPEASMARVVAAMAAQGAGAIGHYSKAAFTVSGRGSFTAGAHADPTIGDAGTHTTASEERIEMVAPAAMVDRVVAALVAAHPYEEAPYDIYEHRGNAGFIGRRGQVAPATTLQRFAEHAAEALGCEPRLAGDPHRTVDTAAVIPGSGRSFVHLAGSNDVVVTGDIGHHDAQAALERGQAIVDPGHAPSERPGVARLYSLIEQIATSAGVEVLDLTTVDPNPWSDTWRR